MRSLMIIAALTAALTAPAAGQSTMDWPTGEFKPYQLDSGIQRNAATVASTVFAGEVSVKDAAWLRVYFQAPVLQPGSYVRITAPFDNEVQVLDAAGLAMWGNSTAYFNGDRVVIELIAAPGSAANQIAVSEVAFEIGVATPRYVCGICNGSDDRVPSDQDWAGRLLPAGCSASVWNEESCLVSAGHCITLNDVIQFRVPASNSNCSLNHPPVSDQFPVTAEEFTVGGPGNDWAVMTTGTNNLGQTPFERFGQLRPVSDNSRWPGDVLEVWGYGTDNECVRSQTQQYSVGVVRESTTYKYMHDVDTTGGNSGSGILHNGEIVGIATHCACFVTNDFNTGQRVDRPSFVSAREALCPAGPDPGPPNNSCETAEYLIEGTHVFTSVEATTDGPDESDLCSNALSDVWFLMVPSGDGVAVISVCDADFDPSMIVYGGGCPFEPGHVLACESSGCNPGAGPRVVLAVEENRLYRIRLGSATGATGSGSITVAYLPSPSCGGDVNADFVVNSDDLLAVLAAWGDAGGPADLNNDSTVNADDFLAVLMNWGSCI